MNRYNWSTQFRWIKHTTATVVVILGACVISAGQATANPTAKEPFEMVRALQSAQEQVASGSDSAAAMQRALLEKMDEAFLQLPPEAWQDPRNARASVIHLLSGGNPEVIRHLLTLTPAPVIDLNLMEASLAYVEGREEDMLTRLADVDPLNLPPSLGGHIALVKAVPYIQTDPVRAMELLQIASLLMPGTLVEEAALRREVLVAGLVGDIERFRTLSIRYLRRYRASVYSGDFRRRFAIALDTLGFVEDQDKFDLLYGVLEEFEDDSRRGLYMRLARSALLGGNLQIASKATDQAQMLAVAGNAEYELLKIYQVATRLNREAVKPNRDLLLTVNKAALTPEDLDFLYAVNTVLNSIRHFPDPPDNFIGAFNSGGTLRPPAERDWLTADMELAELLLRRTETMLAQAGDVKK